MGRSVGKSDLTPKKITLPDELLKEVDEAVEKNRFPGVRSLSSMCEYALDQLLHPAPSPEEAKRRFLILRRVFRLYDEGKYSNSEVLNFIAGWCHFAPQGEEEEKLLRGCLGGE